MTVSVNTAFSNTDLSNQDLDNKDLGNMARPYKAISTYSYSDRGEQLARAGLALLAAGMLVVIVLLVKHNLETVPYSDTVRVYENLGAAFKRIWDR